MCKWMKEEYNGEGCSQWQKVHDVPSVSAHGVRAPYRRRIELWRHRAAQLHSHSVQLHLHSTFTQSDLTGISACSKQATDTNTKVFHVWNSVCDESVCPELSHWHDLKSRWFYLLTMLYMLARVLLHVWNIGYNLLQRRVALMSHIGLPL